MNETTTNAVETVTASQRRCLFQEMIGATPEKNKNLWSALDAVIVATCNERDAEYHAEVLQLADHFPHLRSALLLVWEHIANVDLNDPYCVCEPDPSEVSS